MEEWKKYKIIAEIIFSFSITLANGNELGISNVFQSIPISLDTSVTQEVSTEIPLSLPSFLMSQELIMFPLTSCPQEETTIPYVELNENLEKLVSTIKEIKSKGIFFEENNVKLLTIPIYIERYHGDGLKVIVGNNNGCNLKFIIKRDGIYDVKGEYRGPFIYFQWLGKDYIINVKELDKGFTLRISPKNESIEEVIGEKEFYFCDTLGKLKIGYLYGAPVVEMSFQNFNYGHWDLSYNNQEVAMGLNVVIGQEKNNIKIDIETMEIKKNAITGEGSFTFKSGKNTFILNYKFYPESQYVEFSQDKNWEKKIDEFITELAYSFRETLLEEFARGEIHYVPPLEELKKYFYHLIGDDRIELMELIEEVDTKRYGISIPTSIEFSYQGNPHPRMKGNFPLVIGNIGASWDVSEQGSELAFLMKLPKLEKDIFKIGIKSEAEEFSYLFLDSDTVHHVLWGIEVSPQGKIKSIQFNVSNLELKFKEKGFSFGSSDELYIGSLVDYVFSQHDFHWYLEYFNDSVNGTITVPFRFSTGNKGSLTFGWNGERFNFGFQLPFMFGGNLKYNDGKLSYSLNNKSMKLNLELEQNKWKLKFESPPERKK